MMRAAVSVWVLAALVCGGSSIPIEQVAQNAAVDSGVSLVSTGNKDFAFQLYRKLAAHADSQGKNVFYSPSSVSLALAALSAGARGKTHKQIFAGLGFNDTLLTQKAVNEAFHDLLESGDKESKEAKSEGTAVFLDDNFKAKPEFLDVLKKSYFADGFTVDFAQTQPTIDTINKYVSDMTNGKINKMVEGLSENTIMYLLSYITFKGKWATPFDPKLTKEDMFLVDEKTKVPVQMMNMEDSFHMYYDMGINTTVVRVPFNSSQSMLLLLPEEMSQLENVISPNHLTKWMKWMRPRECNLFMPKLSIKTSYTLKDVLADMGMVDMFGPQADLSGIADNQELVVSKVVHKATLDVDEAGATATAATGVEIMLMSLQIVPVIKFNRPFMVLVTENTTDRILFVGKVMNPSI